MIPERRDRRSGVERRQLARETFDRRKMRVLSAVITGDLAKGWLVFSTKSERRRYSPLPEHWADAPDAKLRDWCQAATALSAPRRLIE